MVSERIIRNRVIAQFAWSASRYFPSSSTALVMTAEADDKSCRATSTGTFALN
jgi:hypothetical protein